MLYWTINRNDKQPPFKQETDDAKQISAFYISGDF